jgi:hypothetical protein
MGCPVAAPAWLESARKESDIKKSCSDGRKVLVSKTVKRRDGGAKNMTDELDFLLSMGPDPDKTWDDLKGRFTDPESLKLFETDEEAERQA